MTVAERDREAIRGRVRKPVHAIRREVVVLPLLAVGNDRGACGFEPLDGVPDRILIEKSEVRIVAVAFRDSLDEISGSWDAADGLGGYGDRCRLGHTALLCQAGDLA